MLRFAMYKSRHVNNAHIQAKEVVKSNSREGNDTKSFILSEAKALSC